MSATIFSTAQIAAASAASQAQVPMLCVPLLAALPTGDQRPSAESVAWLWHVTFETFESAIARGLKSKRTKRVLIRFLAQRATFLGRNEATIRRSFGSKFQCWRMNGRRSSALVDRRIEANRKRRVVLPEEDRDKVIGTAIFQHGGDVAPAWRACLERGELSRETSERYLANPSRKTHVPHAVARDVIPEAKLLMPHFHGPRQARLRGAFINRDWSKVGAGDVFQLDDFTLEIYWSVADGHGWHRLTRGQLILMIDVRSKLILDWILIPEKHYRAVNARTLINRWCRKHHLPRVGFHLECGIWKASKLLGGAVPWGEVEMNFAERLGIKISHALPGNARSKVIENVGKLLQSRLRGLPGWVGPNEQVLKIERVQAAKLDVEARRKTPAEAGFLSMGQFEVVLSEVCERYNADMQDSVVMGGRFSPRDAWSLLQTRNDAGEVVPVAQLPESCWYLLCSDARIIKCGRNGIVLPKSLGGGTYRNEFTGRMQGRQLKVYFDPEFQEQVQVVDGEGQVHTIPVDPNCPAYGATPEQMTAAQASVSAHTSYARERYSKLRLEYMPPVRATFVDPRTAAIGREIKAQQSAAQSKQQANQREQGRVHTLARKAGLNPSAVANSRALEKLNEALEEM